MDTWRTVWREGFVPGFTTAALQRLRQALMVDDRRLTQGATTNPAPTPAMMDWPAEAVCAIGWCGWRCDGLDTVAELEEFFSRACFEADCRLGEAAASRWFLNWYDDAPRDEMRRELLAEVGRELVRRRSGDDLDAIESFAVVNAA